MELRHQLSELMMHSQNNEQRLKSQSTTLDNLAIMVSSIMNKLESKSTASPPTHSGGNHHQDLESPPKSGGENQAQ